jgi:putative transposase
MKFPVNITFQWIGDPDDPKVERVLYVDPSCTEIVIIDVDEHKAVPIWYKYADLEQALEAHEIILLEVDHRVPVPLSESDLDSEKYQKFKEHRDKIYSLMAPLLKGENAILMLLPNERARLIAELVASNDITRQSVYVYQRHWWQRGQTPNAFLPLYTNSGRRLDDKPRQISEHKLGRPSLITKEDKEHRPTGVNVDDYWRDIILQGGELFYENRRVKTLRKAYLLTIGYFCNKGFKLEDGKKKPILPDPNKNEVFTYRQFQYHYLLHMNRHLRRAILKRVGLRRFNLRHREHKGNSKRQATGPGSLYQIDATLADVYLVSNRNRNRIIGRPVFYAVIDVFSRMIVGICVRLEGEGWLGIKLALDNATADKVAFCARYEIEITEEMWPVCYLPERITGDRGPVEGKNANNIVYSLNIAVLNTAPFRADWKGHVEQLFHLMNIRVFHALPGAVDPEHERGDGDYRMDAVLDIHEFTQIVIRAALYHNLKHRMNWFFTEMDPDMIEDEVQPYPAELYYWGVNNRSGHLRRRDAETIRINLLPEDEASVTEDGIMFRGLCYTCKTAEDQDWTFRAQNSKRWRLSVAYDPRLVDIIYLRFNDATPSEPCFLKDPDSPFKGCDWSEVEEGIKQQKLAKALAEPQGLQDLSDFNVDLKHIVAGAKKKTKAARALAPEQSKRSRVKNIKEHRRAEVKFIQQTEAQELLAAAFPDAPRSTKLIAATSDSQNAAEDYEPIPQLNNVRDIRERMMNNAEEENQ